MRHDQGQPQFGDSATIGCIVNMDVTAMLAGNLARQVQTQTGTGYVLLLLATRKLFKQMQTGLCVQPRAVVAQDCPPTWR